MITVDSVLDELADAASLPRVTAMTEHLAGLGVTGREDAMRRKLVDRLKLILAENASWQAQQTEDPVIGAPVAEGGQR